MKTRIFLICLVSLFGFCGCLTPPKKNDKTQQESYFPLEVHRYWMFEKTVQINKEEKKVKLVYGISQKKGNAFQMIIETETGYRESASIHLREQDLFLIRSSVAGKEEACFLKSDALVPGKSWPWSNGTATVLPIETIQVPAGTFETIPVQYEREAKLKGKTVKLFEKLWFAKGIGWVKNEQKIQGGPEELAASASLIKYGFHKPGGDS